MKVSRFWKVIAVIALLGAVAATNLPGAGAQNSQAIGDPALFGMVGITKGQTARLNVVIPPDAQTPPGQVLVVLKFVDGNGNLVLGDANCYPTQDITCSQTSVMLSPGQSASFELSGDSIVGSSMTHTQIRPVIIWQ